MRKIRVEKDDTRRGNYWNVIIKDDFGETVTGAALPYTEAYQLKLELEAEPQLPRRRAPLVLI